MVGNNDTLVHIGGVKDGSLVCFPHSNVVFMKVCDSSGMGGVVDLMAGEYIPTNKLCERGLNLRCWVVADDIDAWYYDEDTTPCSLSSLAESL